MEVGYVILARYAETNPDGTVDIVGGDFGFVRGSRFPIVSPVAVVAKLRGVTAEDGDERGRLLVALDVLGPDGDSLLESPYIGYLEPKRVPKNSGLTTTGSAHVLMNLGDVEFSAAGRYEVRLRFGDGPRAIEAVAAVTAEVYHD